MFSMNGLKLLGTLCLSFLCLSALAGTATAQDKPVQDKQALIKELLRLTNAGDMAQNFSETLLAQLENTLPQMLSNTAGASPDIDPKLKAELDQKITEMTQKLLKRFRAELPKRVNFAQVVEQISIPLYDRVFTEAELKDLINFYRSPTGQKAVKAIPQLLPEIMQEADKILTPPITTLITELMDEIKDELPKTGPPPPKQTGQPGSTTKKKP